MAVLAAIALATFLLEDDYFVALDECLGYFTYYFGSFDGRSAYLNGTVGVYEEDTLKLYGLALFLLVAEIMYIQELALFGLELLSLDFYNCVHCVINCKLYS